MLILSALGVSGCAQVKWGLPGGAGETRADAGDVTGGLGGASGAAVAARPVRLAEADWTVAQQAIRDALDRRGSETVPWINPDTGTMGTAAFRSDASLPRDCAGFDLTVLKGESAERLKGHACKNPKGGMRIEDLRAYSAL